MNALINLKNCKEFMTITLNNKDHRISAFGAGCASRIKLAGTIDDPYFCGRDVCDVLGYESTKNALQKHVQSDEKTTILELQSVDFTAHPTKLGPSNPKILTYNEGKAVYINEPGLYSLIISSQAPFAKEFKKLVCKVILPSIRKYGSYQIEQQHLQDLNESF